jgi:hypothetical protein
MFFHLTCMMHHRPGSKLIKGKELNQNKKRLALPNLIVRTSCPPCIKVMYSEVFTVHNMIQQSYGRIIGFSLCVK